MFDLLLNILPLVLKKQLVVFQVESCHFAEEKHIWLRNVENGDRSSHGGSRVKSDLQSNMINKVIYFSFVYMQGGFGSVSKLCLYFQMG